MRIAFRENIIAILASLASLAKKYKCDIYEGGVFRKQAKRWSIPRNLQFSFTLTRSSLTKKKGGQRNFGKMEEFVL
jgi:hypothetical protein